MKTVLLTIVTVVLLTAVPLPANGATLFASNFTTGPSGWTSLSFLADPQDDHPVFTDALQGYSVNWSSTGGNPGGMVQETDQDGGWQYFVAPSAFLGDQSAAFGGTLSFDLLRTDSNTGFLPQTAPALALTDGTAVLVFEPAGEPSPTTAGWTSYSLRLTGGSGVYLTTPFGATATPGQVSAVLSNLTGLYVLGDWYTGIGDSYDLRNVTLSSAAIPEPSSWALLLAGALALGLLRRRRRA